MTDIRIGYFVLWRMYVYMFIILNWERRQRLAHYMFHILLFLLQDERAGFGWQKSHTESYNEYFTLTL